MTINCFPVNMEYSEKHVQHVLRFLRRLYHHAVYFNGSRFSVRLQREFKVDVAIENDGYSKIAEIKTVQQHSTPLSRLFAEDKSCSNKGRETDGWVLTSEADLLIYSYILEDGSDTYIIDMQQFKIFYTDTPNKEDMWHYWINPDENRSAGYLIPLREIRDAIPSMERYRVYLDGSYKRIW